MKSRFVRQRARCPNRADAVEKGFCTGGQTTLIQDEEQMRKIDSRIHAPGFVRFNFQFHIPNAVTFSTVSVKRRRTQSEQMWSGFLPKADSRASIADVAEGPIAEVAASQVAQPYTDVIFASRQRLSESPTAHVIWRVVQMPALASAYALDDLVRATPVSAAEEKDRETLRGVSTLDLKLKGGRALRQAGLPLHSPRGCLHLSGR